MKLVLITNKMYGFSSLLNWIPLNPLNLFSFSLFLGLCSELITEVERYTQNNQECIAFKCREELEGVVGTTISMVYKVKPTIFREDTPGIWQVVIVREDTSLDQKFFDKLSENYGDHLNRTGFLDLKDGSTVHYLESGPVVFHKDGSVTETN